MTNHALAVGQRYWMGLWNLLAVTSIFWNLIAWNFLDATGQVGPTFLKYGAPILATCLGLD